MNRIPISGLLRLGTSSTMVAVRGPDAPKFLNGLLTLKMLPSVSKGKLTTISSQDLDDLKNAGHLQITQKEIQDSNWGLLHEDEYAEGDSKVGIRRDGRYGLFLNSRGRVISDLFVYSTPFLSNAGPNPSYILELNCNINNFNRMLMLLRMHKLRSNIKLEKISGLQSWFYFNESNQFQEYLDDIRERYFNNSKSISPSKALDLVKKFASEGEFFKQNVQNSIKGFAIDDRSPGLGIRMITDINPVQLISDTFLKNALVTESGDDMYSILRMKNGIIQQSDYPSSARDTLPFENNIDYMGGINYNKGCYIGQELTNRTWTRGVIRKRVMPVQFYQDSPSIPFKYDGDLCKELGKLDGLAITKRLKPQKDPKSVPSNPFSVPARKSSGTIGHIITKSGNLGLASVGLKDIDLDSEDDAKINVFTLSSKSDPELASKFKCKVMPPDWWPAEDDEEEEE